MSTTLFLAVIGALILVIAYLPFIVVLGIAGIAILAIIDNVQELRA